MSAQTVSKAVYWVIMVFVGCIAFVWSPSGARASQGIQPREATSTLRDRKAVRVTIYNHDRGLVKDVRRLRTGLGLVRLRFEDVAAKIDPTSVHIRATDGEGSFSVVEQNFEYDLINRRKLMLKYLGRDVDLVLGTGPDRVVTRATLIGVEPVSQEARRWPIPTKPEYVFKVDDRVVFGAAGRIELPKLPEGFVSKPTLFWLLESDVGEIPVEVSYLTGGLQWEAEYLAVLSHDERSIDLAGWVTIDNRSGSSYENALLKLVAGNVHRVERMRHADVAASALAVADGSDNVRIIREEFFEYHVYALPRPTDLKDNQSKQIALLEAQGIGIEKSYVCRPRIDLFEPMGHDVSHNDKVGVYLAFVNSSGNGLGEPLPMGVVRTFKEDGDGLLEFIGEDIVTHTPVDERVRLRMGDAFDVRTTVRQTEFNTIKRDRRWESTYEVVIRNHKREAIDVAVELDFRFDWVIKQSSHELKRLSASRARSVVPVGANGEGKLIFEVLVER